MSRRSSVLGPPSRRKDTESEAVRSKVSTGRPPVSARPRTSYTKAAYGSGKGSSAATGSSSVQRGSSVGGRRGSRTSVYGQGGPTVKKDPRPLSDKSYQQACIRRLCTFLVDRNYPRDVKPRSLQTPSTKEFLYILNFVLEHIEQPLVVTGLKLEEEIPYVLKYLGYPFNISRNHLLSIGSPHSWPIILGSLIWLIDSIEMAGDSVSHVLFPEEGEFQEGTTHAQLTYDMNSELYRLYLLNTEEYEQKLIEREGFAQSLYRDEAQKLDKVLRQKDQLQSVVNELQQSSIQTLEDMVSKNQQTYDTEVDYVNNKLIKQISDTESTVAQVIQTAQERELETSEAKMRIQELQEHIKRQPMTAREAQAMNQQIKDKNEEIAKMRQRIEEERARVSELQMQHNTGVFKIDECCKRVNDKIRRLVVELKDASCIEPLNYNTSNRADPTVIPQLQQRAKQIKGYIQQLNQQVASTEQAVESNIISCEAVNSTLQNEIVKKQLELEELATAAEQEKRSLDELKVKREEEMKACASRRLHLSEELKLLHESIRRRDKQDALEECVRQKDAELAVISSDMDHRSNLIQRYCLATSNYIESFHQDVVAVANELRPLQSEYKALDIIKVDHKEEEKHVTMATAS